MKPIKIHIFADDELAKEAFKDDPRVVVHPCENPTCTATFNDCKHSRSTDSLKSNAPKV